MDAFFALLFAVPFLIGLVLPRTRAMGVLLLMLTSLGTLDIALRGPSNAAVNYFAGLTGMIMLSLAGPALAGYAIASLATWIRQRKDRQGRADDQG